MGDTKIEWTDKTWNPIRGCARVSEGCRNCYAMKMAHRQSGPGKAYHGLTMVGADGPQWTGKVRMVPELMAEPLRWKKPRKIFVNSMSDLFHEGIPFDFIDCVFMAMICAPQHTYQILTKRPERALEYMKTPLRLEHIYDQRYSISGDPKDAQDWPLPHVQIGVSVEDQPTADKRIHILRRIPAAVRFISCEPLLAQTDLCLTPGYETSIDGGHRGIHWVIVGGESGHGARPMHPDWVRSIRDQCQSASVPFFFKQWGAWEPVGPIYDDDDAHLDRIEQANEKRCVILDREGFQWPEFQPPPGSWMMERVGKKNAGRLLDGRTWDEFPEEINATS